MIRGITNLEGFIRGFAAGVLGVLVDHIDAAVEMGASTRRGTKGRWYVLIDGRAYPVLCGDLVSVDTEDGPVTDRCGKVAHEWGQCPWHAAETAAWRSLSEAEKAAVEREEDLAAWT